MRGRSAGGRLAMGAAGAEDQKDGQEREGDDFAHEEKSAPVRRPGRWTAYNNCGELEADTETNAIGTRDLVIAVGGVGRISSRRGTTLAEVPAKLEVGTHRLARPSGCTLPALGRSGRARVELREGAAVLRVEHGGDRARPG